MNLDEAFQLARMALKRGDSILFTANDDGTFRMRNLSRLHEDPAEQQTHTPAGQDQHQAQSN